MWKKRKQEREKKVPKSQKKSSRLWELRLRFSAIPILFSHDYTYPLALASCRKVALCVSATCCRGVGLVFPGYSVVDSLRISTTNSRDKRRLMGTGRPRSEPGLGQRKANRSTKRITKKNKRPCPRIRTKNNSDRATVGRETTYGLTFVRLQYGRNPDDYKHQPFCPTRSIVSLGLPLTCWCSIKKDVQSSYVHSV